MSKKNDTTTSDRFNNPFSKLKGLSVSGSGKPAGPGPQPAPPSRPEVSRSQAPAPVDETEQFARAMGELGVRRTVQGESIERPAPGAAPAQADSETQAASGGGLPGGDRRQIRKKARRIGAPEATLDLHGIAAADAVRKVEWFLDNARFHDCRAVLIVTGKGAHSATGAVLKPLVEDYLSGPGRRFASNWTTDPKSRGGALLVALQRRDESEDDA